MLYIEHLCDEYTASHSAYQAAECVDASQAACVRMKEGRSRIEEEVRQSMHIVAVYDTVHAASHSQPYEPHPYLTFVQAQATLCYFNAWLALNGGWK